MIQNILFTISKKLDITKVLLLEDYIFLPKINAMSIWIYIKC